MTYRRPPGSIHAALTAASRLLGEAVLAGAMGVSADRLRQMKNPMRRDLDTVERLRLADRALVAAGHPPLLFDWWRRTAEADGTAPPDRAERRARALEWALRRIRAAIDAVLEPPFDAGASRPCSG